MPFGGRANLDFDTLLNTIGSYPLEEGKLDGWKWLDPKGKFIVSKLTRLVEAKALHIPDEVVLFDWNRWVPLKVNFCVWRASINCLPSKVNLLRRGIPLELIWCEFCGIFPKTLDHYLVRCNKVRGIWHKIFSWWKVNMADPLAIKDILCGNLCSRGKEVNKLFLVVCYTAIWMIWNWRNHLRVATDNELSGIINEDVFSSIQRKSLIWLKNRGKEEGVCWNS